MKMSAENLEADLQSRSQGLFSLALSCSRRPEEERYENEVT